MFDIRQMQIVAGISVAGSQVPRGRLGQVEYPYPLWVRIQGEGSEGTSRVVAVVVDSMKLEGSKDVIM
jgi:hypothetical protein